MPHTTLAGKAPSRFRSRASSVDSFIGSSWVAGSMTSSSLAASEPCPRGVLLGSLRARLPGAVLDRDAQCYVILWLHNDFLLFSPQLRSNGRGSPNVHDHSLTHLDCEGILDNLFHGPLLACPVFTGLVLLPSRQVFRLVLVGPLLVLLRCEVLLHLLPQAHVGLLPLEIHWQHSSRYRLPRWYLSKWWLSLSFGGHSEGTLCKL